MEVPPPTFCPDCRLRRRFAWINLRTLYPREVNGTQTISTFAPEKPYVIMEDKEWWSDAWDASSYGKDYDFSKPFFEQFRDLLLRVPLPHLQREYATMVNSDYCNAAGGLKNCYLVAGGDQTEDTLYAFSVENLKDCMDMLLSLRSELCYESSGLRSCFKNIFCEDCEDSQELIFCQDCIGCTACFGSINLRNKSYYIFNKPYSKEDYYKTLERFQLGSYAAFAQKRKESEDFSLTQPHGFMHGRKNEDVQGDYIYESKNVKQSFIVGRGENCKYAQMLKYVSTGTKDAYDYSQFGVGAELVYEAAWCGLNISNIKFSCWNYGAQNLEYCFGCHSSKDLFGCVGVRRGQYCILNKQYNKESFDQLKVKIIQQMKEVPYVDAKGRQYRYGEFFPAELSPYGYNETLAQYYFPLLADKAGEQGYTWFTPGQREVAITLSHEAIPDHISEVRDDIVDEVIACQHSGQCNEQCSRGFRIILKELELYRKLGLPLPRLCPNCRHFQRITRRNPLTLWHRTCQCKEQDHVHGVHPCSNEFETAYAPERREIVYCAPCYQEHLI